MKQPPRPKKLYPPLVDLLQEDFTIDQQKELYDRLQDEKHAQPFSGTDLDNDGDLDKQGDEEPDPHPAKPKK